MKTSRSRATPVGRPPVGALFRPLRHDHGRDNKLRTRTVRSASGQSTPPVIRTGVWRYQGAAGGVTPRPFKANGFVLARRVRTALSSCAPGHEREAVLMALAEVEREVGG